MSAAALAQLGRGARWRRRWAHRVRVVVAMVLLTVFGAAQRWVPMRRWSGVLGRAAAVPPAWLDQRIATLPVRAGSVAERQVLVAVQRAARALPWTPTCLAEAAAGQVLLRRVGAAGVVVIGLRRTDPAVSAEWDAHAWLLGARGALTGGPAARGFTATTVYEVPGGRRAADVELAVGER